MKTSRAVWEKSLAALQEQMTPISYNTWITPIQPICIKDNTLVLQAENETAKNTLRSLYTQMVTDAVNRANGSGYLVRFIDESERGDYPDPNASKAAYSSDFTLNPKYTFESFVIGSSNNFAHAAAQAVADNPSSAYNPLFIYGGVGLGKTHLMHAIGHRMLQNNPDARIIYVTSETFTIEFIQSIQENKNAQFRNKYRSADVLMVDDIQFISSRERTQEEFFNTFNALHTSGKQIILSSDRPPMELTTLEERLRSRFEGGLITDVQPPDLETRIAILKKKAMEENIDVDESVLSYIAEKVNSNIRQLEGSLTRVCAYAKLTKRPLDAHLADAALKDIIPGYENRKVTVELIQQVVADYYSVDVDAILSQRRTMEVTYPRQVAMYLSKELTEESLKAIGRRFGGRDHTTVISACKKIRADIKENPQLVLVLEDLTKRIRKS